MCRWIVVGMLTLGSGVAAWGQSGTGNGVISLAPGGAELSPDPKAIGPWTAVSAPAPRSTLVPVRPTVAPSPAPPTFVHRGQGDRVQTVPVGYQVVRYVPVAESSVVPAPATVAPSPTPWAVLAPPIRSVTPRPVYYLGRGIIGQPKLYVPGQPIRNALRFLTF